MYSIKQVSDRLGIPANAIRFYEKKGLICPERTEGNYRSYSTSDIATLQSIMIYRKMGFSIETIDKLLKLTKINNNQANTLDIFVNQYNMVNRYVHSMQNVQKTLGHCIEELLGDNESGFLELMEETSKHIAMTQSWEDQWNFNDWAAQYDTSIREETNGLDFYKNYDEVLEFTASQVTGKKIAEIGIGTGNLAKIICKNNKEVQYIGIDQSINMLKESKKKCKKAKLYLGDFLNLPLDNQTVDTVVTSYAFHHCTEDEKRLAIEEMDRVLDKHGEIVITDLMFKTDAARKKFEKTCNEDQLYELEDEFFTTAQYLESVLKEMNYKVKTHQIDELIWCIKAKK